MFYLTTHSTHFIYGYMASVKKKKKKKKESRAKVLGDYWILLLVNMILRLCSMSFLTIPLLRFKFTF